MLTPPTSTLPTSQPPFVLRSSADSTAGREHPASLRLARGCLGLGVPALQAGPDFTSIPDPPPGLQTGAAPPGPGASRKLASVPAGRHPLSAWFGTRGVALESESLRRCWAQRLLLYRRIRADTAG